MRIGVLTALTALLVCVLGVAQEATDGCIAVTNAEMDEIWQAVRQGTPI